MATRLDHWTNYTDPVEKARQRRDRAREFERAANRVEADCPNAAKLLRERANALRGPEVAMRIGEFLG